MIAVCTKSVGVFDEITNSIFCRIIELVCGNSVRCSPLFSQQGVFLAIFIIVTVAVVVAVVVVAADVAASCSVVDVVIIINIIVGAWDLSPSSSPKERQETIPRHRRRREFVAFVLLRVRVGRRFQ